LARLCDHAADDKTKLEAHVRSFVANLFNFHSNNIIIRAQYSASNSFIMYRPIMRG